MKLEALITLGALAAAAYLVTSGAKARQTVQMQQKAVPTYTTFFGRPIEPISNIGGDPSTIFWPGAGLGLNLQPVSMAGDFQL